MTEARRGLSLDLTEDKSISDSRYLTAPSHYLNQCLPRSLMPYGVTRTQWVNLLNCFGNIRKHISIFDHFLTLRWCNKLQLFHVVDIFNSQALLSKLTSHYFRYQYYISVTLSLSLDHTKWLADDTFKCISWVEIFIFSLRFHCSLFPDVQCKKRHPLCHPAELWLFLNAHISNVTFEKDLWKTVIKKTDKGYSVASNPL